jgi:TonB-linked SusC/RagA family outer membrane protein
LKISDFAPKICVLCKIYGCKPNNNSLIAIVLALYIINQNQISLMSKMLTTMLQKQKWFLTMLLAALGFAAQAQVTLKGKVTDSKGNGIPSISVVVKGTNLGTTTAPDGTYMLNTALKPGKYKVEFSGVGLKSNEQSFTVGSDANVTIDASLSDDVLGLDEVVVTGTSAGTTKKQLGNYVGTIKGDKIANAGTSNVLSALQGKVAGAQIIQNSGDPGGGMTVRLRGLSTISSSSDPLYIVDGVIINNTSIRVTNTQDTYDASGGIGQNRMMDINPNDIEKIEVLNGAAAAAIYGSRANAGVVQIFTKKGKSGAPTITYTTRFQMSELRKRLSFNTASTKFGGTIDAQTQDILTPTLTTTTPVTRYDYTDDIFRKAIGTDQSLSISAGTDKSKFYASLNFNSNEGIIKNTDNKRFGLRVNVDQTISKWLSISAGLNYTFNTTNEKPDGNSFFSPMNAVTIIGNFHNIKQRDGNGNLLSVGERGRLNPLSVIDDIQQQNKTSRIISSFGFKINVLKGLNIDYMAGVDNVSQSGNTFMPPYAYNASTGFFGGGATLDPTQNGYASAGNYNALFFNHDFNATYTTNVTDDLVSTTQLGYSEQYEKNQYTLVQSRGLAPFVSTATGGSTILPSSDSRSETSVRGVFLQQNFKYKNFLFLTAAGRIDGSSVFAAQNQNQFYPKVSASFLLTETDVFKDSKLKNIFNLIKVRAAYGESGNLTGIGAFERFNTYNTSSYLGRTGLTSSAVRANDNIRVERQKELEFGLDLGLLNGRISFTMNVYNKTVSDLIVPNVTIAPSVGFSSERKNVGTLENNGIELLLTGVPVKTKKLTWEITGAFNKNKNKITNVGAPLITFSSGTGAVFALIPGNDAPVFYSTYYARDAAGVILKNTAGIPVIERGNAAGVAQRDPATGLPYTSGPNSTVLRKPLGTTNPDFTASLSNTITYDKFSLSFLIDAVQGGSIFNADFRTRQGVGNGSEFAQKEHNGELPRGYIAGIYAIEEWRVEDASYTKLRELSLSYNIGAIGKTVKNMTVTFSGRNLISWDTYRGYDPETNATGQSSLLRNIDFGNVPIPRSYQVSITTQF